jgi:hypothetical protein
LTFASRARGCVGSECQIRSTSEIGGVPDVAKALGISAETVLFGQGSLIRRCGHDSRAPH